MKTTITIDEKIITIQIEGSVDTVTAPALHADLADLPVEEADEVCVDLSKTHYISSAGLREFLILQKRLSKGQLKIRNTNEEILEILDITGFSHLFDIVDTHYDEKDFSLRSLKDFISQKVSYYKDLPVIDDGSVCWTWGELDAASDVIAEDLINLGAKRGSHIAICGANSLNWIATFFAIQKLGAIAILVNPLLKPDEICFLSHAGDISIFCHGIGPWLAGDAAGFLAAIQDPQKSQIKALYDIMRPVDFKNRTISPITENFMESIRVRSDDPCVMIFTSGSTGVPKGVLLSSMNMLMAADCGKFLISVEEGDVMCLVLPLFHIFGLVASLLYSMLNNVKIVMPKQIKPQPVLETIEKYRCSFLFSVPTLLMGIAADESFAPEKVSSLRHIVIGGAPVSEKQMMYLKNQFSRTAFCMIYGLSEMSPVSFTRRGDTLDHITRTVGMPAELVKVRIEDVATKEECPVGETGEILIRGTFLMSGYYKTPIEKQDFDADGWFHTGDLGYMDEQGYLHFAGRKKELIIRGGENIFPGEIADMATTYPQVISAQVVGIPDEYFGEIVGCALTVNDKSKFDEEDFRNYLKERLAPHKIPSHIAVYDTFPLLANGKVNVLQIKKDMTETAGGKNE